MSIFQNAFNTITIQRRKTRNIQMKRTNSDRVHNPCRTRRAPLGARHKILGKPNFFTILLLSQSFQLFTKNCHPLFCFFFLPNPFFSLPVRSSIAREVEIDVKRSSNKTPKFVYSKTSSFTRNKKFEMIMALKFNIEISCKTT